MSEVTSTVQFKIRQIHEDGSEPAVIYDKSFSQLYETTDCIYLYDYIKSTALNVWAAKRDAKRDKHKEQAARDKFFGK